MAWRFAPSKFKNTTPKLPKKEDTVFDLPIGNLSVTNNGIQASHNHVAFCIDGEGGKLGVVPVGAKGRRLRKDISVVCAHGEQVDDFNFMTFNDDLLVTCSRDERIKMWRLGAEGADPILEADLDLGNGSLLGSLMPHSTASGLVAYTSTEKAFVVDWETQSVACELDGIIEKGLSCSWSDDGKMLASTCDKGRVGLVWDPRAGPAPVHTLELHSGMGREARILFAGDKLVSSGFTNKRVQEVRIFDTLKYGAPVHSEEFTATTGLLIPLYDPDTKLLFLGGKGTNKLVMTEIQTRSPILSRVFELSLPDQLLGACLGNKRSVSVMEGEVQTFYELTKNSILPLPCIVPRRSYRDFHSDLYPDTRGSVSGCSAMQWISGTNAEAAKVSLAPAGVATSTSPTATAPAPRAIPQEPASRAPAAPQIAFRPPSLISHPSEDKKQVNGSERPIAEVRPTQKVAEQAREDSPSHEMLARLDTLEQRVSDMVIRMPTEKALLEKLESVVRECTRSTLCTFLDQVRMHDHAVDTTQSMSVETLFDESSTDLYSSRSRAMRSPKTESLSTTGVGSTRTMQDNTPEEAVVKMVETRAKSPIGGHKSPVAENHSASVHSMPLSTVLTDQNNDLETATSHVDVCKTKNMWEQIGSASSTPCMTPEGRRSPVGTPGHGKPPIARKPSLPRASEIGKESPLFTVSSNQNTPKYTDEGDKENLIVEPKKQPAEPDVPRMRLKTTDEPCAGRRPVTRARPKSCVVGQIASKFRHVEVLAGIKANNSVFSNLRNVNTRLPPEANGICVSNKRIALPLSGPAGIISILDVNEPCKLPDGVMDGIFNKSQVTDLQWNPFNENELACGTDCGAVNIWKLSAEDGPRNEMEPARVIRIGGEKIVALRWHPLVSDLMAIALSDASVELWNVKDGSQLLKIPAHDQAILGIAWSAFGHKLATVGKDLMVRVFEPQRGENCLVAESKCLESPRSARILFACDDQLIVVVGFTKSSSRKVQLYDADSLKLIHTEMLDNAVQPLVPYYDFDTSVMFLTGKGDRTVVMYEVCVDSPYLLPLSSFICPSGHQALAFHNKTKCNVMSVEFQRAWKLTDKTIELLIFRVPRVKKDVFQADLFPDALVTWTPSISVEEYANGKDFTPQFQCLKPDGVHSTGGSGATAPRLARMSQFAPSASPAATASKSEEKQEAAPATPALAPPSSAAVNVPSPITEADESTSTIRSPTPNDPAHTVDNVNGGEHAHTSSPTSPSASANPSQTSTEGAVAASGDASSSSARSASTTTVVGRDAVQELAYGKAVYGKAPLADMDEDEVKKEVLTSWSDRITVDKSLEQEHMEGVAEEEWIDD